jgi:hypothetical protein
MSAADTAGTQLASYRRQWGNQPFLIREVPGLSKRGLLAEEENLLQRSAFLKVERSSSTPRVFNEREDGDCPSDGLSDRDSLAAGVLLQLVGQVRTQVHREPH